MHSRNLKLYLKLLLNLPELTLESFEFFLMETHNRSTEVSLVSLELLLAPINHLLRSLHIGCLTVFLEPVLLLLYLLHVLFTDWSIRRQLVLVFDDVK